MTDKINVTIECGGYTITGAAGDTSTHIVADDKTKPAWIGSAMGPWSSLNGSGNLGASNFLFIESDVPGKLHKFKGVEYIGLVDAPRNYHNMLHALLTKFKGALVIFNESYVLVVYKDMPILSGCGSVLQCINSGNVGNLVQYVMTSEVGRSFKIYDNIISLEMEAAAKLAGDQFIKEYERLMAL